MESSGTGAVIDPLFAVEHEELSGVLEFRAQGVTTRIYAREGEVVFADAGTTGETLGRMLIRSGRLTEEQVAAVIRRMTDALVDNEHVRFGEIVVEYGFLSADELELALTQQVKEKVMGCVHRGDGAWSFLRDDPRVDEVGSFVVHTRPMLVEAAGGFPERRVEEILHLDDNRYPELIGPEAAIVDEFELSGNETALLKELDGTSSIHFILSKSVDAAPLIAALVLGSGVELRTTPSGLRTGSENRPIPPQFRSQRRGRYVPPQAALPTKTEAPPVLPTDRAPPPSFATDPPSVLPSLSPSLPDSAHSAPTIMAATPALRRRTSRENLAAPSKEALARASAALHRLRTDLEARKPLNKKKRWPEPKDEKERRLMAEAAFHQGRLHLRAEEAERALPGLSRAHELCPGEREYELYVKWAKMLVNDTFKEETPRAEVQRLAAALVRENRDCELGYSILGHCAMNDGNDEAALRFFQRAAALDPKLVDAARLARLLAMRAGNRPKRSGKVDASARAKERGLLATPLDEIVPALIQRAADALGPVSKPDPRRRKEHGAPTPHGGLRVEAPSSPDLPGDAPPASHVPAGPALQPSVAPSAPSPPSVPPPSARPFSPLPPPPPADLRPPPPPSRPQTSPWRVPPRTTESASIPAAPLVPTVAEPLPQPQPGAPDEPSLRARPKRRALLALVWIASIGATGAVAYVVGGRTTERAPTTVEKTATPPAPSAAPVASSPPVVLASATAPVPSASTASAGPTASLPAKPGPDAATATNGVIRTKAHGRRIFVDGHLLGEGARDFTVRCGSRRVRVGSSGVERTVLVPCGRTIDVD